MDGKRVREGGKERGSGAGEMGSGSVSGWVGCGGKEDSRERERREWEGAGSEV
ncbi:hypothetical protein B0H12DRAFT_1172481 [Mycena haematopus]|nr:hypothetical protein B0H12DRAFT_1172481 [Mycena haematopus]